MNKNWFISILFLIQCSAIFGQAEISVQTGLNRAGFYQVKSKKSVSSDKADYKHHIGYTASVFYKEPVSDKMFSGLELENMQVKSDLSHRSIIGQKDSVDFNGLFTLNYVNLHILYGASIPLKRITLFIEGSPYFGFMIHSNAKGVADQITYKTFIDSLGNRQLHKSKAPAEMGHATAFIKGSNVGLRLQLGSVIPLNTRLSLQLNASYYLGIYNVSREKDFIGITGLGMNAGFIWKLEKNFLHLSEWKSD